MFRVRVSDRSGGGPVSARAYRDSVFERDASPSALSALFRLHSTLHDLPTTAHRETQWRLHPSFAAPALTSHTRSGEQRKAYTPSYLFTVHAQEQLPAGTRRPAAQGNEHRNNHRRLPLQRRHRPRRRHTRDRGPHRRGQELREGASPTTSSRASEPQPSLRRFTTSPTRFAAAARAQPRTPSSPPR